jgi:hypothetical protein
MGIFEQMRWYLGNVFLHYHGVIFVALLHMIFFYLSVYVISRKAEAWLFVGMKTDYIQNVGAS